MIMRYIKLPCIGLGLAILILLGSGFQALSQERSESVIDQVRSRGTLRVGISTFMPRAMKDKNGKLIGFDVDVANKIAEDLGVKPELILTDWDAIIPSLLLGKFDVIISGLIVTPARNLTVNFSDPYATDGVGMAANAKLAAGFNAFEDFNKPSIKIAVRRGATPYIALVRKLFPQAVMLEFDDDDLALKEVLAGKAHAVLSGEPRPTFWCMDHRDTLIKPFNSTLTVDLRAIALRKGDADSLNFFNNWIRVRTNDGWLRECEEYWFKSRKWADLIGAQK